MQLAILHYHLNRGGVTQAIANHLMALATLDQADQPQRVALVTCGRREGWPHEAVQKRLPFPLVLIDIPTLDYDNQAISDPAALATAIRDGLQAEGFSPDQTILHTHNHALGKNASLPGALRELASEYCQLLQVHDFAEDSRPANYRMLCRSLRVDDAAKLAEQIYPQGAGIHYATLTSRDRGVLASAGVEESRLHVLPNPIAEFDDLPSSQVAREEVFGKLALQPTDRLVTYPVRGIRRKNVGEMLLHSALTADETYHAITLAPANPAELASFDRWQALAKSCKLNCLFDIGASIDFLKILAASDAIITTSLAEGFGMVFLEAWLAGRPLVGRNLPEITADFTAEGVELETLVDTLQVPLDWVNRDTLKEDLAELHRWSCLEYGSAVDADADTYFEQLLACESIDFGSLPSGHQKIVIQHVADSPEASREAIHALNPHLAAAQSISADSASDRIQSNAEVVRKSYSTAAIGKRLHAIYTAALASPAAEPVALADGSAVLDFFLHPERLSPVRLEP